MAEPSNGFHCRRQEKTPHPAGRFRQALSPRRGISFFWGAIKPPNNQMPLRGERSHPSTDGRVRGERPTPSGVAGDRALILLGAQAGRLRGVAGRAEGFQRSSAIPLAFRHSRIAGRTSVEKADFRHSSASTSRPSSGDASSFS